MEWMWTCKTWEKNGPGCGRGQPMVYVLYFAQEFLKDSPPDFVLQHMVKI